MEAVPAVPVPNSIQAVVTKTSVSNKISQVLKTARHILAVATKTSVSNKISQVCKTVIDIQAVVTKTSVSNIYRVLKTARHILTVVTKTSVSNKISQVLKVRKAHPGRGHQDVRVQQNLPGVQAHPGRGHQDVRVQQNLRGHQDVRVQAATASSSRSDGKNPLGRACVDYIRTDEGQLIISLPLLGDGVREDCSLCTVEDVWVVCPTHGPFSVRQLGDSRREAQGGLAARSHPKPCSGTQFCTARCNRTLEWKKASNVVSETHLFCVSCVVCCHSGER